MRVILAGQRSFGAAVYDALLKAGHEVPAVWCPQGDTDHVDKLYRRAQWDGVWSTYPRRTSWHVGELDVDLFVAAHSHDFIGRDSRAATKLGGIGYHPSLLPRHRGRDAVRWTVHMGDPVTGGSVYWLTDNVDGGPIAAQDWCFVPPAWRTEAHAVDGVSALWRQELFPMGVRLLLGVLSDLEVGTIVEVPQDEHNATWEPSWDRPPLYRPELPQIGGAPAGYEYRVDRSVLSSYPSVPAGVR